MRPNAVDFGGPGLVTPSDSSQVVLGKVHLKNILQKLDANDRTRPLP